MRIWHSVSLQIFVFLELSSHAMNKPDAGKTVYFKVACPYHQQHCVHQHQRPGWTKQLQVFGPYHKPDVAVLPMVTLGPPDDPIDIPAQAGGGHISKPIFEDARLAAHQGKNREN